jgi:glyoxylate reductase
MNKPKHKILVTRNLPGDAVRTLDKFAQVILWQEDGPMPYEEIKNAVSDCDGLLCMLNDNIDESLISSSAKLKVISTYSVGYNQIDLESCRRKKITIGNTPKLLTDATAELALGLLVTVNRQINDSMNLIKRGDWKQWHPTQFSGQQLQGKTLGIIGLGRIGSSFAKKCKLLYDMNIIYFNRNTSAHEKELSAQKVELDFLYKNSDVISLHCSLGEESKKMINAAALVKMKNNCILINTARGEMIDEEALIDALKNDSIWGAGLDVADPEPMSPTNVLLELPRVVVTSHIGSAVRETRVAMAQLSVNNLIEGLKQNKLETHVMFRGK